MNVLVVTPHVRFAFNYQVGINIFKHFIGMAKCLPYNSERHTRQLLVPFITFLI